MLRLHLTRPLKKQVASGNINTDHLFPVRAMLVKPPRNLSYFNAFFTALIVILQGTQFGPTTSASTC